MGRSDMNIAAVVTAAGLSSRMGDYKPLLPFGGETIARRCIRNLLEARVQTIIVVTGHRAQELMEHLGDMPVTFVHNEDYVNNQMFDSLCLGLRALPENVTHVLVTPVDIPAVQPGTIARLLETKGELVRPTFGGKSGHPVLLSGDAAAKILTHDGTMGLRGAIETLGLNVQDVEVPDRGILYDADTPEDYERLLRFAEE